MTSDNDTPRCLAIEPLGDGVQKVTAPGFARFGEIDAAPRASVINPLAAAPLCVERGKGRYGTVTEQFCPFVRRNKQGVWRDGFVYGRRIL